MNFPYNLNLGLGSIPILQNARTRSITAENPEGKKGFGGQATSKIGKSRKGRPSIDLTKGKETILADIKGSGIIQHIWITMRSKTSESGDHLFALRDVVLKMYWDDSNDPSVEVPIGDFFCCGHGVPTTVNSIPIVVNPAGGMNTYFPMPYKKSARISVLNEHIEDLLEFYYQITYTEVDELSPDLAYFNAEWRRSNPNKLGEDHIILDDVNGQGHFVGTYLAWTALQRHWWGEGEVKFFIDDDTDYPTICGTGTEDYVGGAWCFDDGTTYSTPYLGYPMHVSERDNVPKHGLYRWHILDPVRFSTKLKVTVQSIGWLGESGLFERSDDISSVAYWYQNEINRKCKSLPKPEERWPR